MMQSCAQGSARSCLVLYAVSRLLTVSRPSSSTPTITGLWWMRPGLRVASTARWWVRAKSSAWSRSMCPVLRAGGRPDPLARGAALLSDELVDQAGVDVVQETADGDRLRDQRVRADL